MNSAEELEFFEFLFFSHRFLNSKKHRDELHEHEKNEQMDLIVEGIKSILSAVGR